MYECPYCKGLEGHSEKRWSQEHQQGPQVEKDLCCSVQNYRKYGMFAIFFKTKYL